MINRRRIRALIKELRASEDKETICITLTIKLLEKIDEERGKYRLSRSAFLEWILRDKLLGGFHY